MSRYRLARASARVAGNVLRGTLYERSNQSLLWLPMIRTNVFDYTELYLSSCDTYATFRSIVRSVQHQGHRFQLAANDLMVDILRALMYVLTMAVC